MEADQWKSLEVSKMATVQFLPSCWMEDESKIEKLRHSHKGKWLFGGLY